MADEETVEEYQARIAAEYGQYVANQSITHNGSLAYTAGQSVPASNVARWKYDEAGVVDKVTPKKDNAPPIAAAVQTEKGK